MRADGRRKPAGTVLLMALLVMSGVLIVGASLGTISLLNLRQSRVTDDSIIAFGAAESGIEQSLYQLRRSGTPLATLTANPNDSSSAIYSGPPMTNGSNWARALKTKEPTVTTQIPKDKSFEVVLWDPDSPASPAGVKSLNFTWNDSCGGTSGLEVMAAGWNPALGAGVPYTGTVSFHGDSPVLTFLHDPVKVVDNAFLADQAYRVRLRAKTCDIYDLTVRAFSADSNPVDIPSRTTITSNGTYGAARQSLQAMLPRLQPMSGVFDYVIFSQCSLLKGVTGGPPCT